jgi:hypothetical protein
MGSRKDSDQLSDCHNPQKQIQSYFDLMVDFDQTFRKNPPILFSVLNSLNRMDRSSPTDLVFAPYERKGVIPPLENANVVLCTDQAGKEQACLCGFPLHTSVCSRLLWKERNTATMWKGGGKPLGTDTLATEGDKLTAGQTK